MNPRGMVAHTIGWAAREGGVGNRAKKMNLCNQQSEIVGILRPSQTQPVSTATNFAPAETQGWSNQASVLDIKPSQNTCKYADSQMKIVHFLQAWGSLNGRQNQGRYWVQRWGQQGKEGVYQRSSTRIGEKPILQSEHLCKVCVFCEVHPHQPDTHCTKLNPPKNQPETTTTKKARITTSKKSTPVQT